MIKYQIMNNAEDPIINRLSIQCISVYLVTNPSKNPATMKIGTNPMITFVPCLIARTNEALRV